MTTNQDNQRTLCDWDSPAATEIIKLQEQRDELLAVTKALVSELNNSPLMARAKQSVFNAKARVSAAIAKAERRAQ